MTGDVNRLLSMIKQADLPYRVFEEEAPRSQSERTSIVRTESPAELGPMMECAATPTPTIPPGDAQEPATEVIKTVHKGLFSGYWPALPEQVQSEPSSILLAELFHRMASAKP